MCDICKHPYGSTGHLLYWAKYWLKHKKFNKLCKTLYHIINRRAHRKWFNQFHKHDQQRHVYDLIQNAWYSDVDDADDYVEQLMKLEPLEFYNKVIYKCG